GLESKTPVKKAKLQVLSGSFARRVLEPNKALTTLGRPGIEEAAITRRQDGCVIVHVDTHKPYNYPLVNGTAIGSQPRMLHDEHRRSVLEMPWQSIAIARRQDRNVAVAIRCPRTRVSDTLAPPHFPDREYGGLERHHGFQAESTADLPSKR